MTDTIDHLPPTDHLPRVGTRETLPEYLREVWRRREFMVHMPLNVLRSQNRNTSLGNIWHLLNPLLQVTVYYAIFGLILGTDRGVDNFLGFLTVGLFVFRYSQKALTDAAGVLQRNEGLIRSIQFPRAVLPISTVISQLISFGGSLSVVIVTALVTQEYPTWRWLLLLPILALQTLFNLGGGFFLARIAYRTRDVVELLPHLFRLVFYSSGVMFSVESFVDDPILRVVFDLNPFYDFVSLARWAIMGDEIRSLAVFSAIGWTIVLFIGGFFFFRAADHEYGRT